MKAKISIGLNMLLAGTIGILVCYHALTTHYYAEFTGMLLRKAASQIESGNAIRVGEVFSKVQGRPTLGDIGAAMEKLYF